jgi:Phage integrase, N-terminal SAM-like domain
MLFHNKRHPKDMGVPEIEEFLTHLATTKNVSASTQNQAFSSILSPDRSVLHNYNHRIPQPIHIRLSANSLAIAQSDSKIVPTATNSTTPALQKTKPAARSPIAPPR